MNMKHTKCAAWFLCLACALMMVTGAWAAGLPSLGLTVTEDSQPEHPQLTDARRLQFFQGDAETLPNDTDTGAYLLGEEGAALTLLPEQTAALATLAGEAVDMPAGEDGVLQIAVAEEPLRLTLSLPEQEAQSWLLLFTQEQVEAQCEAQGYTWAYAPVEHVVRFTDAEGNPVAQVFVNVCTDTLCTAYFSDDNGEVAFSGEGIDYVMHVLQVPEGYEFDTTQEIPVLAGQELVSVVLKKK